MARLFVVIMRESNAPVLQIGLLPCKSRLTYQRGALRSIRQLASSLDRGSIKQMSISRDY